MPQLGPPPGPTGLPLVGVAGRFKKDPAGFLLATAREFGDVTYFRVGLRRVYLVNRADLIDEVLVHSLRFFTKPPAVSPVDIDIASMTTEAAASIAAWTPNTPFEVTDEVKRLFPPMPKPSDPNAEPRSMLDTVIAGHEDPVSPLSSAVGWMLIALAQNPGIQQRLHESGGEEYALQVVSEVLRLYPPVWTISRVARSQFRLFNYLMPPEAVCLLSPYVTHRHPRYWSEPDRFDPDRFTPDLVEQRPRFAYFPFGTPELCAGRESAASALVRLALVITQLWRIRMELSEPVEPWGATSVLWPRNPVSISVGAW